MIKRRTYKNLGKCPACQTNSVYVYSNGPTGYFSEGDECICEYCGHDGEMVEKYDQKEPYCEIKWEPV